MSMTDEKENTGTFPAGCDRAPRLLRMALADHALVN
jgi:hypothetical protein